MADTTAQVRARLAALENPKVRAANERRGDDHGVNLGQLRALAREYSGDTAFARDLWATGDTASRLLAVLVCRPRDLDADELDVMIREARAPKVHDWLVSSVVRKSRHAEQLRRRWLDDGDPEAAAAGWDLTAHRVATSPAGLDLDGLLDRIDAEMVDAPARLQWAMNTCLARIGIHHAGHRARALETGARLGVLKDYPTPAGCTSPYAPTWITTVVGGAEGVPTA